MKVSNFGVFRQPKSSPQERDRNSSPRRAPAALTSVHVHVAVQQAGRVREAARGGLAARGEGVPSARGQAEGPHVGVVDRLARLGAVSHPPEKQGLQEFIKRGSCGGSWVYINSQTFRLVGCNNGKIVECALYLCSFRFYRPLI